MDVSWNNCQRKKGASNVLGEGLDTGTVRILNEFYPGASGRSDGFSYYKNPSTLVMYFATFKQLLEYFFKQLLEYFFRMVHGEGGHFTRTSPEQRLPGEVIRVTAKQRQALQEIVDALDTGMVKMTPR